MAPKLMSIRDVLEGGENIPRNFVVSGKKENFLFLVWKISVRDNGNVIIDGAKIDSNQHMRLNQDTKIFHVFASSRTPKECPFVLLHLFLFWSIHIYVRGLEDGC